jgi:hypothetical protein
MCHFAFECCFCNLDSVAISVCRMDTQIGGGGGE